MVSQQIRFNNWHRCRRYWKVDLDCPFAKLEGHEDDDEIREERPRPTRPPASEPRQPVAVPLPATRQIRRPVPIVVGKDDTLDDLDNRQTVKEVLQFPDLRENPFTDRPPKPVPIPQRAAARKLLGPGGVRRPGLAPQPSAISPTPAPSRSPSRQNTLQKGAALETAYAQELAQQYSPSASSRSLVPSSSTTPALASTPRSSQRTAQLAAFTQLRNSSVYLSRIARGDSRQQPLSVPHGRRSTARSPGPSQYSRPYSDTRSPPKSSRPRGYPWPLVPPTIGRGGRSARGGGGFNFNFSARLRALLNQRGFFGPAY